MSSTPPVPLGPALTLVDSQLSGPSLLGTEAEPLRPGTRLDEFEIIRVLGAGGFGIVYLALDQVLLRYVAIKEFMPAALATRTRAGSVAVRSAAAGETFAVGLESFFNEGRLLARFDHPSLVKVFRFWKANGTAYMAMQYYPGQTLKEARRAMPEAPDEAWLRSFMVSLLGALEVLHGEGVFHRDIAPDNILLLPDGQPVILDFGSARRVIGDRTQSLTAILKPNYSPVEQYADDDGMRQGPYTDLYALGGTVYFMLSGRDPTPAVMRAVRDSFPLLANAYGTEGAPVSAAFLRAIDWTLAVSPDDRPQTAESLRSALRGECEPPTPSQRHSVLIADGARKYDDTVANAKTEIAQPRAPVSEHGRIAPSRRRAFFTTVIIGVAIAVGILVLGTGDATRSPRVSSLAHPSPLPSPELPLAPHAESVAVQQLPPSPRVVAPPEVRSDTIAERKSPKQLVPHLAERMRPTSDPHRAETMPGSSSPQPAVLPATKKASALCADLGFFARTACLSQSCESAEMKTNPQCIDARRTAEQRQRRMDQ